MDQVMWQLLGSQRESWPRWGRGFYSHPFEKSRRMDGRIPTESQHLFLWVPQAEDVGTVVAACDFGSSASGVRADHLGRLSHPPDAPHCAECLRVEAAQMTWRSQR